MSTAVTGRVVNVTIEGEQFDLVEEDSVDYDAGESTNDFELAAKAISETFHEVASPTVDFTSAIDGEGEVPAGWEAAGIFDPEDGSYTVSGTRRVTDVTLEWLDADEGEVELGLEIPAATVEFSGAADQTPVTYDITLHINEEPSLTGVGAD